MLCAQGNTTTRDSPTDEENVGDADQISRRKIPLRETLLLAYSSLGAVYGDIGTSPLYVLDSIKYPGGNPTQDDIYGAISVIFYLFVFLVLFKYALIVLTFGPNEGEGGQVAIYAKIARCLKSGPKGVLIPGSPVTSDLELLKRTETVSSFVSAKSSSSWKQHPLVVKAISMATLCACFLGCSLVMSDGLLTPTTSVLSAVAGIQVAQPSFKDVLPVSEAILVVLFLVQQYGSHKLSHVFAPVVLVWMIGLAICGVINISHHPAILKSLSPYYAITLLKRTGVDALGGAMLAITGCEAMFADLGHFGRAPCQIGIVFVFVCLVITYLGQGAYLVDKPQAISNVFYESIPGGLNKWPYWTMFVLATLSTVIASQALILGVFSILAQLINLDCFPKLRVSHVSASYAGKVYIPVANFLLLVGVTGTTAGFKNSNNVTAAYGLGISLDFVVTSTLMIICMVYVYDFQWWIPTLFCLVFVPLEFCLVVANLKKVPHGAWFPLMMCAIFFSFLAFWRYCREQTVGQQLRSRVRLGDVFPAYRAGPVAQVVDLGVPKEPESDKGEIASLTETHEISNEKSCEVVVARSGSAKLNIYPGVAIVYSDTPNQDWNSPNTLPGVYVKILHNFASVPSVVIFINIRVVSIPTVEPQERILLGATKVPGHYRCALRFGFMEQICIDQQLGKQILEQVERRSADAWDDRAVLHIFESNKIRSHDYVGEEFSTRNPAKRILRYTRRFAIDHVFGPINLMFQFNDLGVRLETEEEERNDKLFVGSVMRI